MGGEYGERIRRQAEWQNGRMAEWQNGLFKSSTSTAKVCGIMWAKVWQKCGVNVAKVWQKCGKSVAKVWPHIFGVGRQGKRRGEQNP